MCKRHRFPVYAAASVINCVLPLRHFEHTDIDRDLSAIAQQSGGNRSRSPPCRLKHVETDSEVTCAAFCHMHKIDCNYSS